MLDTPVSHEQYSRVQSQLIDMLGDRNAWRASTGELHMRICNALAYIDKEPIPDRDVLRGLLSP